MADKLQQQVLQREVLRPATNAGVHHVSLAQDLEHGAYDQLPMQTCAHT